jgi:hypothetical protein
MIFASSIRIQISESGTMKSLFLRGWRLPVKFWYVDVEFCRCLDLVAFSILLRGTELFLQVSILTYGVEISLYDERYT